MLSGTVHRDQLQRLRLGRIDELVLRSSRHDHDVRGLDVLVLARNRSFAFTRREDQDLVCGVSVLGMD